MHCNNNIDTRSHVQVCPLENDDNSLVVVIGGETSVSRENEHSTSIEVIGANGLCRAKGERDREINCQGLPFYLVLLCFQGSLIYPRGEVNSVPLMIQLVPSSSVEVVSDFGDPMPIAGSWWLA